MRLLIGEDFSPWTEKARWALDWRGVPHAFAQFQPLIDEPWLRLKTGNFSRKATVPVLVEGSEVLGDSFAIARHAERVGVGPSLWPPGREAEIDAWNDTSERALRAGRALFFGRFVDDPDAQLDQVPPFVPAALRPLLRPVVRSGVAYLRAKHGADAAMTAGARDALDGILALLGRTLAGTRHLLGDFSYADVAMAVVCQFVRPVDDRWIRLAPATRRCWTEAALAEKHRDVIAWRDELYARYRRPA
jgi:glutathione S-transferase